MFRVLGRGPACSSTKGWTGHTLGACGHARGGDRRLVHRARPGAGLPHVTEPDPAFRCDIATANRDQPVRRVLSNSFGFGGSNCSLILGLAP